MVGVAIPGGSCLSDRNRCCVAMPRPCSKWRGCGFFVADDLTVGTHLLRAHQPEVALLDTDEMTDWAATLAVLRAKDPAIPFVLLVGGTKGPREGSRTYE